MSKKLYKHGIGVEEKATTLPKPKKCTAGVQVVVGTAAINTLDNPEDAVNKPILVNEFDEAVEKFGYNDNFDDYTLYQSVFINFKHLSNAPIVLINVLDPAIHRTEMEEKEYPVQNRQCVIDEDGILLKELVVKSAAVELTAGKDYIASFDTNGHVVITTTSAGSAVNAKTLTVSGYKIDPKKVTENDIIGGYDVDTGAEKGLECIRKVFPRTGIVPGLILAPKWSKNKNVAAALMAKSVSINGLFKAFAIIDLDTTKATKYEDVESLKEEYGIHDENCAALWPMVAINKKKFYYSAVYAARLQQNDRENGDVIDVKSSNQDIGISEAILEDGTEVLLDESQANELNAIGVVTLNNFGGTVFTWGNNTAAYPYTSDPKDRRTGIRRFFSWWGNRFILDYHTRIDDPTNYKKVEALIDDENILGNSYAAQGKCAGAKIEFDLNKNPLSNILNGHIEFTQKLAPYPNMEYVKNTLEFDPSMIEAEFTNAFGGGDN